MTGMAPGPLKDSFIGDRRKLKGNFAEGNRTLAMPMKPGAKSTLCLSLLPSWSKAGCHDPIKQILPKYTQKHHLVKFTRPERSQIQAVFHPSNQVYGF